MTIPLKPKAQISLTSLERNKATIQSYRIENKMLKSEIQNLQHKISKSSMKFDDGLSADLIKIMSNADRSEVSPSWNFSGRNNKNTEIFLAKHQSVTIQW